MNALLKRIGVGAVLLAVALLTLPFVNNSGAAPSNGGIYQSWNPEAAITSITDNSTGTASNTIAAGVGVTTIPIYLNLATLTDADQLTAYTPGYAFKVLAVDFATHIPVTTGSKASTINLEIGTTNLTGGAVALTSAACTPRGAIVAGSAVTAANTGTASDTISIEASSTTAFVEGSGWLLIKVQNMDTANAIASLTAKGESALDAMRANKHILE